MVAGRAAERRYEGILVVRRRAHADHPAARHQRRVLKSQLHARTADVAQGLRAVRLDARVQRARLCRERDLARLLGDFHGPADSEHTATLRDWPGCRLKIMARFGQLRESLFESPRSSRPRALACDDLLPRLAVALACDLVLPSLAVARLR